MTRTSSRWVILWVSFLIVVGMSLPYYGWTPSLTSIQSDLALDNTQAASLMSVTAILGGLTLVIGGGLIVRFGARKVILAALLIAIAGQVLFSQADGYTSALVARAVSGVAVGLLIVAPYTVALSWFRESRQVGRAAGIMLASDGIGVLFALVVFGAVLVALGWQSGLLVQAAYLGVLFVLAMVYVKDAPTGEAGAASPRHTQQGAARAVLRAARDFTVLRAAAFYVGLWGLFALVVSWMPTILAEGAGWSATTAGLFASLSSVFGIVTAVAFGLMADSMVDRRRTLILLAGTVVTAFVGLLSVAVANDNYLLAALALPLIGLAGYAGAPLTLAAANESVDGELVGAVNGLVLGGALFVGGVLYPTVLGVVRDATGSFAMGFFLVTAATFLLCVVTPLLGRDRGGAATQLQGRPHTDSVRSSR